MSNQKNENEPEPTKPSRLPLYLAALALVGVVALGVYTVISLGALNYSMQQEVEITGLITGNMQGMENNIGGLINICQGLENDIGFLMSNRSTTVSPIVTSNVPLDMQVSFTNGSINFGSGSLAATTLDVLIHNGCLARFQLGNFTFRENYDVGNSTHYLVIVGNGTSTYQGILNFSAISSTGMTQFMGIFKSNITAENFQASYGGIGFFAQDIKVVYIDDNNWFFNVTNCAFYSDSFSLNYHGSIAGVSAVSDKTAAMVELISQQGGE